MYEDNASQRYLTTPYNLLISPFSLNLIWVCIVFWCVTSNRLGEHQSTTNRHQGKAPAVFDFVVQLPFFPSF